MYPVLPHEPIQEPMGSGGMHTRKTNDFSTLYMMHTYSVTTLTGWGSRVYQVMQFLHNGGTYKASSGDPPQKVDAILIPDGVRDRLNK